MTNPNTIMELQQELEIHRDKLAKEIKLRTEAESWERYWKIKYDNLERGIDDMVKKITAGFE